MNSVLVRRYRPKDRDAVWRIGADTAFFGRPVEAILDDRQLFIDLLYRYYTEEEPEYAWAASVDDRVVGFLVGCPDTRRRHKRMMSRHLPRILGKAVSGRYRLGRRTWQYLKAQLRGAVSADSPAVDLGAYPAHLHMNVDASFRGRGIGRRLLTAYLAQLRALGICGVHLQTTSLNLAAAHLYRSLGLRLIASRPTLAWQHLVPEPVENLAFGLSLD